MIVYKGAESVAPFGSCSCTLSAQHQCANIVLGPGGGGNFQGLQLYFTLNPTTAVNAQSTCWPEMGQHVPQRLIERNADKQTDAWMQIQPGSTQQHTTHTHTYIYICIYIYACIYLHVCVRMYIYVYEYVFIFSFMNF